MEKPILIAREELMEDIADVINRSRLHLIIVEPILRNLLTEVRAKIQQEYEAEKAKYEAAKAETEKATPDTPKKEGKVTDE